jgi:branched-subunit amino acid transport protein
MTSLDIWITIALLTAATLITRAIFWLVGQNINLPERVQEALRYAPACALAAIIVPDLVFHHNQITLNFSNPQLIAGVIASAFFLYKRSMFGAIIVGMAAFTLVRLST